MLPILNLFRHPIVYLKDVNPKHLELLLSYMYKGEINVLQNDLGPLIETAKGLQIKVRLMIYVMLLCFNIIYVTLVRNPDIKESGCLYQKILLTACFMWFSFKKQLHLVLGKLLKSCKGLIKATALRTIPALQ